LEGHRPHGRDRCIKIAAVACDAAVQSILASYEWRQLRALLARASDAAGPEFDWSNFETLYVPCLGSIEASPDFVEGYGERILVSSEDGKESFDITRGWVSARQESYSWGRSVSQQAGQGPPDSLLIVGRPGPL
jgi:hypothetical protein